MDPCCGLALFPMQMGETHRRLNERVVVGSIDVMLRLRLRDICSVRLPPMAWMPFTTTGSRHFGL